MANEGNGLNIDYFFFYTYQRKEVISSKSNETRGIHVCYRLYSGNGTDPIQYESIGQSNTN